MKNLTLFLQSQTLFPSWRLSKPIESTLLPHFLLSSCSKDTNTNAPRASFNSITFACSLLEAQIYYYFFIILQQTIFSQALFALVKMNGDYVKRYALFYKRSTPPLLVYFYCLSFKRQLVERGKRGETLLLERQRRKGSSDFLDKFFSWWAIWLNFKRYVF